MSYLLTNYVLYIVATISLTRHVNSGHHYCLVGFSKEIKSRLYDWLYKYNNRFYSTMVGYTVQWWVIQYNGGLYSTMVGYTVQWCVLQYNGAFYSTMVGYIVQ